MIGLGLSVVQIAVRQLLGFDPKSLFAASEPGVWYDPSDFSTMFQDAAGTTPVTAVEQPVGLILDKSKGLVLGPELVTNGDFSNGTTGWTAANAQSAAPSVVSAEMVVENATATTVAGVVQTLNLVVGKTYKASGVIRRQFGDYVHIAVINNAQTAFVAQGAQITGTSNTAVELVFTATETNNKIYLRGFSAAASPIKGFFDNISVRELPGNHAYQTTATSRPVLKQDGNGKYYLRFDGVDDWLVTPTITPGTDKVQVFAGVRKLSDAAAGTVTEIGTNSNTVNGSFGLFAPVIADSNYRFQQRGTATATVNYTNAAVAAPITNVLTGLGDISGDSAILRVNGTQAAISTADQGTGNYLAYPLYIGRRGGTTLPFNGHLYGLIVRFGANLPAGAIASTESWVAGKTGITL